MASTQSSAEDVPGILGFSKRICRDWLRLKEAQFQELLQAQQRAAVPKPAVPVKRGRMPKAKAAEGAQEGVEQVVEARDAVKDGEGAGISRAAQGADKKRSAPQDEQPALEEEAPKGGEKQEAQGAGRRGRGRPPKAPGQAAKRGKRQAATKDQEPTEAGEAAVEEVEEIQEIEAPEAAGVLRPNDGIQNAAPSASAQQEQGVEEATGKQQAPAKASKAGRGRKNAAPKQQLQAEVGVAEVKDQEEVPAGSSGADEPSSQAVAAEVPTPGLQGGEQAAAEVNAQQEEEKREKVAPRRGGRGQRASQMGKPSSESVGTPSSLGAGPSIPPQPREASSRREAPAPQSSDKEEFFTPQVDFDGAVAAALEELGDGPGPVDAAAADAGSTGGSLPAPGADSAAEPHAQQGAAGEVSKEESGSRAGRGKKKGPESTAADKPAAGSLEGKQQDGPIKAAMDAPFAEVPAKSRASRGRKKDSADIPAEQIEQHETAVAPEEAFAQADVDSRVGRRGKRPTVAAAGEPAKIGSEQEVQQKAEEAEGDPSSVQEEANKRPNKGNRKGSSLTPAGEPVEAAADAQEEPRGAQEREEPPKKAGRGRRKGPLAASVEQEEPAKADGISQDTQQDAAETQQSAQEGAEASAAMATEGALQEEAPGQVEAAPVVAAAAPPQDFALPAETLDPARRTGRGRAQGAPVHQLDASAAEEDVPSSEGGTEGHAPVPVPVPVPVPSFAVGPSVGPEVNQSVRRRGRGKRQEVPFFPAETPAAGLRTRRGAAAFGDSALKAPPPEPEVQPSVRRTARKKGVAHEAGTVIDQLVPAETPAGARTGRRGAPPAASTDAGAAAPVVAVSGVEPHELPVHQSSVRRSVRRGGRPPEASFAEQPAETPAFGRTSRRGAAAAAAEPPATALQAVEATSEQQEAVAQPSAVRRSARPKAPVQVFGETPATRYGLRAGRDEPQAHPQATPALALENHPNIATRAGRGRGRGRGKAKAQEPQAEAPAEQHSEALGTAQGEAQAVQMTPNVAVEGGTTRRGGKRDSVVTRLVMATPVGGAAGGVQALLGPGASGTVTRSARGRGHGKRKADAVEEAPAPCVQLDQRMLQPQGALPKRGRVSNIAVNASTVLNEGTRAEQAATGAAQEGMMMPPPQFKAPRSKPRGKSTEAAEVAEEAEAAQPAREGSDAGPSNSAAAISAAGLFADQGQEPPVSPKLEAKDGGDANSVEGVKPVEQPQPGRTRRRGKASTEDSVTHSVIPPVDPVPSTEAEREEASPPGGRKGKGPEREQGQKGDTQDEAASDGGSQGQEGGHQGAPASEVGPQGDGASKAAEPAAPEPAAGSSGVLPEAQGEVPGAPVVELAAKGEAAAKGRKWAAKKKQAEGEKGGEGESSTQEHVPQEESVSQSGEESSRGARGRAARGKATPAQVTPEEAAEVAADAARASAEGEEAKGPEGQNVVEASGPDKEEEVTSARLEEHEKAQEQVPAAVPTRSRRGRQARKAQGDKDAGEEEKSAGVAEAGAPAADGTEAVATRAAAMELQGEASSVLQGVSSEAEDRAEQAGAQEDAPAAALDASAAEAPQEAKESAAGLERADKEADRAGGGSPEDEPGEGAKEQGQGARKGSSGAQRGDTAGGEAESRGRGKRRVGSVAAMTALFETAKEEPKPKAAVEEPRVRGRGSKLHGKMAALFQAPAEKESSAPWSSQRKDTGARSSVASQTRGSGLKASGTPQEVTPVVDVESALAQQGSVQGLSSVRNSKHARDAAAGPTEEAIAVAASVETPRTRARSGVGAGRATGASAGGSAAADAKDADKVAEVAQSGRKKRGRVAAQEEEAGAEATGMAPVDAVEAEKGAGEGAEKPKESADREDTSVGPSATPVGRKLKSSVGTAAAGVAAVPPVSTSEASAAKPKRASEQETPQRPAAGGDPTEVEAVASTGEPQLQAQTQASSRTSQRGGAMNAHETLEVETMAEAGSALQEQGGEAEVGVGRATERQEGSGLAAVADAEDTEGGAEDMDVSEGEEEFEDAVDGGVEGDVGSEGGGEESEDGEEEEEEVEEEEDEEEEDEEGEEEGWEEEEEREVAQPAPPKPAPKLGMMDELAMVLKRREEQREAAQRKEKEAAEKKEGEGGTTESKAQGRKAPHARAQDRSSEAAAAASSSRLEGPTDSSRSKTRSKGAHVEDAPATAEDAAGTAATAAAAASTPSVSAGRSPRPLRRHAREASRSTSTNSDKTAGTEAETSGRADRKGKQQEVHAVLSSVLKACSSASAQAHTPGGKSSEEQVAPVTASKARAPRASAKKPRTGEKRAEETPGTVAALDEAATSARSTEGAAPPNAAGREPPVQGESGAKGSAPGSSVRVTRGSAAATVPAAPAAPAAENFPAPLPVALDPAALADVDSVVVGQITPPTETPVAAGTPVEVPGLSSASAGPASGTTARGASQPSAASSQRGGMKPGAHLVQAGPNTVTPEATAATPEFYSCSPGRTPTQGSVAKASASSSGAKRLTRTARKAAAAAGSAEEEGGAGESGARGAEVGAGSGKRSPPPEAPPRKPNPADTVLDDEDDDEVVEMRNVGVPKLSAHQPPIPSPAVLYSSTPPAALAGPSAAPASEGRVTRLSARSGSAKGKGSEAAKQRGAEALASCVLAASPLPDAAVGATSTGAGSSTPQGFRGEASSSLVGASDGGAPESSRQQASGALTLSPLESVAERAALVPTKTPRATNASRLRGHHTPAPPGSSAPKSALKSGLKSALKSASKGAAPGADASASRPRFASHMTSFVPLVKRQAVAPPPASGKQPVKVAAIEQAEAARRKEEQKAKERAERKLEMQRRREEVEGRDQNGDAVKESERERQGAGQGGAGIKPSASEDRDGASDAEGGDTGRSEDEGGVGSVFKPGTSTGAGAGAGAQGGDGVVGRLNKAVSMRKQREEEQQRAAEELQRKREEEWRRKEEERAAKRKEREESERAEKEEKRRRVEDQARQKEEAAEQQRLRLEDKEKRRKAKEEEEKVRRKAAAEEQRLKRMEREEAIALKRKREEEEARAKFARLEGKEGPRRNMLPPTGAKPKPIAGAAAGTGAAAGAGAYVAGTPQAIPCATPGTWQLETGGDRTGLRSTGLTWSARETPAGAGGPRDASMGGACALRFSSVALEGSAERPSHGPRAGAEWDSARGSLTRAGHSGIPQGFPGDTRPSLGATAGAGGGAGAGAEGRPTFTFQSMRPPTGDPKSRAGRLGGLSSSIELPSGFSSGIPSQGDILRSSLTLSASRGSDASEAGGTRPAGEQGTGAKGLPGVRPLLRLPGSARQEKPGVGRPGLGAGGGAGHVAGSHGGSLLRKVGPAGAGKSMLGLTSSSASSSYFAHDGSGSSLGLKPGVPSLSSKVGAAPAPSLVATKGGWLRPGGAKAAPAASTTAAGAGAEGPSTGAGSSADASAARFKAGTPTSTSRHAAATPGSSLPRPPLGAKGAMAGPGVRPTGGAAVTGSAAGKGWQKGPGTTLGASGKLNGTAHAGNHAGAGPSGKTGTLKAAGAGAGAGVRAGDGGGGAGGRAQVGNSGRASEDSFASPPESKLMSVNPENAEDKPLSPFVSSRTDPRNGVPRRALTEVQSYDMTPLKGGGSADDEEEDEERIARRRAKVVPKWAREELSQNWARQRDLDPDEIFSSSRPQGDPLLQVFGKDFPRGRKRGDSGDWSKDGISDKEQIDYRRAMGFNVT